MLVFLFVGVRSKNRVSGILQCWGSRMGHSQYDSTGSLPFAEVHI